MGPTPWSERFERIFRNEEVGGSNPPSSTERPSRANSRGQPACPIPGSAHPRSTGDPQPFRPKHLISCEVLSHSVLHQSTPKSHRADLEGPTEGGPAPQIDDEPHSHRKSSLSTPHLTRGHGFKSSHLLREAGGVTSW